MSDSTETDTAPQAAAEAAQAEAEGSNTATVEWGELTPFEVPRNRRDWPFAAVVAAEQAEWPTMLDAVLPAQTLAQIRALRLTVGDITDAETGLLGAIFRAIGVSQGE